MKTFRHGLAFAAVLILSSFLNAADIPSSDTNRFHSPTAGFTIVKPKDWHFASAEETAKNRAIARLKDKEIEEQMRQRASAPLIVITKHKEPIEDLNPSVQVIMRPLGQLQGRSALELMTNFVAPSLQNAMANFMFVEKVKETKIAGHSSAYLKAKYTVGNADGVEFGTLTRMWIIPRGAFLFMLSMSGPQEGPDVSEKEFAAILDSIKINE